MMRESEKSKGVGSEEGYRRKEGKGRSDDEREEGQKMMRAGGSGKRSEGRGKREWERGGRAESGRR